MDQDSVSSGHSSVGKAYENSMSFGITHPLYRSLQNMIEKRTVELAEVKGNMKRSSPSYFMTLAMKAEEIKYCSAIFPEFRIVNHGMMRSSHVKFVAMRRLSLAWCVSQARRLSSTLVVYGSPLVQVLEARFSKATLFVDAAYSDCIHERHTMAMDAYRIYADFVRVGAEAGVSLNRKGYDDFLQGKGVRMTSSASVAANGEVLCVDGMMSAYNPMQVAAMMLVHSSQVAYGIFPYHPKMLLNRSGVLSDTAVGFLRTDNKVYLQYPEGVAGVSEYPLEAWSAWLSSHHFCLGGSNTKPGVWFQLELLKNREYVMFYRLTKLEMMPTEFNVSHALELPSSEPQYAVRSWRLKRLGMNPASSSSWEASAYLAPKRVVDRVYQMVMTLPREQFTRFAVRKQIRVVNDRVTVEGTSVKVNRPMEESLIDALVTDIFCRAFVDRYTAGVLTEHARSLVERISGFSTMSKWRRVWALMSLSALGVWEYCVKPTDDFVRENLDWLQRLMRPDRPNLDVPSFEVAPSYVLLEGYFSGHSLVKSPEFLKKLLRDAARKSIGRCAGLARDIVEYSPAQVEMSDSVYTSTLVSLFDTPKSQTEQTNTMVEEFKALNEIDEVREDRLQVEAWTVARRLSGEVKVQFNPVADPVYVLNEFYSRLFPGIAEQNLEYDTASISLDPQDRHLSTLYMKLPRYFGDVPKPKNLFHSKLRALNVPKRQQTLQELISAIASRNCNAPQVSLPQDDNLTALSVWENFLAKACVPEARDMLRRYRSDRVAVSEGALREWATQSTPDKIASVIADLQMYSKALGEMDVADYLVMLKADVKPTQSMKPMDQRTEAQVIVYHEKPLSAFYSSIFRVLARRFLSLLKPNYHVNLLKDTRDIERFVSSIHPYGMKHLAYLENDFSKYDKSQGKFVFILEQLIFDQLGMNWELLDQWLGGHKRCRLRAVGLGLSLHVMYQRKSGDATTAFGNVLLNVTSVLYAYKPSTVFWGVFMGDDSIVCTTEHCYDEQAVSVLAEVFNLGAKMYCTNAPYFASNFLVVDDAGMQVFFIPDPVKRIERWSMMINGDDPQWDERFISANDSLENYLSSYKTSTLPSLIERRYAVSRVDSTGVADAIATVVHSYEKFRSLWDEDPQISFY